MHVHGLVVVFLICSGYNEIIHLTDYLEGELWNSH